MATPRRYSREFKLEAVRLVSECGGGRDVRRIRAIVTPNDWREVRRRVTCVGQQSEKQEKHGNPAYVTGDQSTFCATLLGENPHINSAFPRLR